MKLSVLTVFPELYTPFLQTSLIKRAQEQKTIQVNVNSFFAFVQPKERIDAPSFGHGAGMLIKPEVVQKAIEDNQARHGKAFTIFFSPQGRTLNQNVLKELVVKIQEAGHVLLVSSRYEGMDTRVEQAYADEVISVGDYVLMGGDLPAMTFMEGLLRLVPGVVGKQESVEFESFSGAFLDHPEYTAPVDWQGRMVPEIVRSGNHQAVDQWRMEQAAQKTVLRHFQWLRSKVESKKDIALAKKYIPPHYVVLMHDQVLIGSERVPGQTSVTSLDLHDIARSCRTYGIQRYFVVTGLKDQQKIVARLLEFWQDGAGFEYNATRFDAVRRVQLCSSLDEVKAIIHAEHGVEPVVIATSAQKVDHPGAVTFDGQAQVWKDQKPVLIMFGTGQGLTPECIANCTYVLPPVGGFEDYCHLSVRSAAAIVLDRWLGISIKKT